ncbi:putative secreted protein [Rhodopirellula sallentina]|uniref:Putative secreted protein n=1 Tax=Rhodopirellula sallentina SM41 TaxID=1263870 RepID=M5U4B8_9BACT|nr:putative secreted protein [Rhodopirellula sallentina]EMI56119.1 putative secreted protein [Rhodopirellula sallentina SM41]
MAQSDMNSAMKTFISPSVCLMLASVWTVSFATATTIRGDETRQDIRSIIEQRRAIMRGEAEGRAKVEVRKSSQADLEKGKITFDDLKFDIEKDEPFDPSKLTKTLKFLNGRKVKLSGYILPSTLFKETNIEQFVLVRDNLECCFGPGAALF